MPTILVALGSLVIGVFIGVGGSALMSRPDQSASSTTEAKIRDLERELKTRDEQVASLQRRVSQEILSRNAPATFLPDATNAAPASAARTDVVPAPQASLGRANTSRPEGRENRAQDWQQEARATARRAFDTRIDSLALALRLRPDQVATLRAATTGLLDSGAEQGWRVFRDVSEKIDQSLNTMLTAEQKELYSAYQQRERNARLDIRTNIEYSMIDVAVGLSPQQSDTVFQTIAAINQLESNPAFIQSLGTEDRDAVRQAIQQQKLEAMSRILTPEQMQVYKGFVETQRAFGRGFMRRE